MCDIIQKLSVEAATAYGLVAQLGERTVRIREVRGFDPLQVHFGKSFEITHFRAFLFIQK